MRNYLVVIFKNLEIRASWIDLSQRHVRQVMSLNFGGRLVRDVIFKEVKELDRTLSHPMKEK